MSEMHYYDPTAWRLVPGRTAHVVVDDQNDFLHPEGWYATHEMDISHMRRVIEPTQGAERRVPAARRADHLDAPRHAGRRGRRAVHAEARPPARRRPPHRTRGATRSSPTSSRRPDDWYVEKTRLSAFFNTNLDSILRALGTETLIISGVLTNQCIGATTKDALFRDYKPVVVEEAVGTATPHLHDPAIEMIRMGWGQVNTLEQTLAELAAFPAATALRGGARDGHDRRPVPARALRRLRRLGEGGGGRRATATPGSSTRRSSGRTASST